MYEHNRLRALPQKVRPPEVDALGWAEWIPQVSALREMQRAGLGRTEGTDERIGEALTKDDFDEFLFNMIKADMVAKTCKNCKFSKKQVGPGKTPTGMLECHRMPPVNHWPVVNTDDICGEFRGYQP